MQEPVRQRHPLRRLLSLTAAAILLCLASSVTQSEFAHSQRHAGLVFSVRADTDSVGLHQVDSLLAFIRELGADSLRALVRPMEDSLLNALVDSVIRAADVPIDTNVRVTRYLSALYARQRTASVLAPRRRSMGVAASPGWQHSVALDSADITYTSREQIQGNDVRYPLILSRTQYRGHKLEASIDRNWRDLIQRRRQQSQSRRRGGLAYSIAIPGGRQSGFTTIFGKNTVDLRVTGNADIRPAFIYNKSEQQLALGQGSRLDPSFNMELRLGVSGTIGDKMKVEVNWDTGNQFDYQNQLKLEYTGYEDEIIQRIEAGNVFLQTQSSLIRGGQSLFGLKSELQLGGFTLTTVASQQEGQSNTLTLEGGAETTTFDSRPTDYSERTHYFLSYYFRNRWEEALSDPPDIILDAVFSGITDLEVWKLTSVAPEEKNVRQVVAVVDLGESPVLVRDADSYTEAVHPDPDLDQYSDTELEEELRLGDAVPRDYLQSDEMDRPLRSSDFQVGQFKKLILGRDYDVDPLLGYISLKHRLPESEALAVSFRYLSGGGQEVQVGDFSSETGGGDNSQTGERIVLKLLKPINLQQPANLGEPNQINPAAWYLEMRNIYRIGSTLLPSEFILDIVHEPPGSGATKTLTGITGQQTLIQVLGLDRLNEDGANKPDDLFDYLNNYTVNQSEGLLIFPYLQPFGRRMEELIDQSGLPEEEKTAAKNTYVFHNLYTQKKINAARNTKLNVYRIQGSYKGGVPAFYDLGAFAGVIPGSVRVTSGGVPLTEGTDFIVDYQGGTINIVNRAYLTSGRDISIEHEENSLFNLQKKTLLGARLDFSTNERYEVGGTVMRMNQKSITDKFRIGEEPVSNLIWGVDGSLDLSPRWLTRFIDAIPLLQTKEASSIRLQGELAQLRPGRSLTNAFKNERRNLRKQRRDFNTDELQGVSYVDDFEGFENVLTLTRPGAWLLSSSPVLGPHEDEGGPEVALSNNTRGTLGWYTLNDHALAQLGAPADPAVSLVSPQAVFPNREATSQERILTTLDLYFSPHERGPYNYNMDLGGFLDAPRSAWGGMTQRLSEGNTDFTSKNIEFVEFVFQPFSHGGDADPEARMFIDMGRISEEVIPDNKLNTEDGLSTTEGGPVGVLARLSTGQQNQHINPIAEGERITEDLGLDGLASFPDNKFEREGGLGTEQQKFQDFLDALETTTSTLFPEQLAREKAKAIRDPSGDDYHYFLDETFFANSSYYSGGASVQQRFARFFSGHELNSYEAQRELSDSSEPTGNTRFPNTEDMNLNSASDTENSYYQYELPLSLAKLDELAHPDRTDDYVVNEIEARGGGGTGWYLVRIPVKEFTRRVGDIQDFTLMESIRVWTTGHTQPITLRFATLELVGSQWRKSESVGRRSADGEELPEEDPLTGATISIESVNNEENTGYEIPNGTVRSRIREAQSGTVRDAREQAMVLHIENLEPGRQLAVFNTYGGINFLRYSNLRMFLHLDGFADDMPLLPENRGETRFFMRIGANEIDDYYEIEIPLTPSPLNQLPDEGTQRSDYIWRTHQPNPDPEGPSHIDMNSLNMELSALNQLKFTRDEYLDMDGMPFPTDSVFWSDIHGGVHQILASFAAPGTRIGIKGTPSLARVSAIVLGVRNTSEAGHVLTDVNVWVNELRVSGYDEETGFAGLFNADIGLADFGRVKATTRVQTDGFGSLQSTLGNRAQVNDFDWTVNTQINMQAFIPERFGWGLPVSMEIKSSSSTPRFDPNRGDVLVSSLKQAIAADTILSSEEISIRQEEIDLQAQTQRQTRSYTARMQKARSRSGFLKATLDALNFSWSFSENKGRSPRQTRRDSWRWNSALNYRHQIRRARVVYPFWFFRGVGFLNALGELTFNYLPNSVSYALTANRNFSISQQRPDPVRHRTLDVPVDVALPVRQQHRLSHSRQFSLTYSPFNFLSMDVETGTNQSLNAAGVDTTFSVILVDSTGAETRLGDTRLSTLVSEGLIDPDQVGVSAFELTNLRVPGAWQVLQRAFDGGPEVSDVRTESYSSRAGGTFRPRFNSRALRWLSLQDIGYTANFSWRNGSVGNNTGARASTAVVLRGGATARLQDLFQAIPFYEKLEESQRAAEAASQARRQERQQQREERREARRRARDAAAGEGVTPVDDGTPADDDVPPDTTAQRGPRLPGFLSPAALLRRVLLTATGIQDISFTYNGTRRAIATNVGHTDESGMVVPSYSLYDAIFNSLGPSIGYRLGLESTIDPATNRIINDRLQVTDQHLTSDRYQGRMTLSPTSRLQLSFDWSHEYSTQSSLRYRTLPDGSPVADTTHDGDSGASVWVFGSSYLKLFQRQVDRYYQACGPDCGPQGSSPDTVYSRVLTNETVVEDFMDAYLTGAGATQPGGVPFPMPSWRARYSGISSWPLIRSISTSASLNHSFSGTYSADFRSNLRGGQLESFNLIGGPTVVYALPTIAVDAVRINKRFQPLIGLDFSFRGGVQTSFSWNQSVTYALSTTNNVISDTRANEMQLTASFSSSNLKLPFMPRRLNNRISFSVTLSRSVDQDRSYYIRRAVESAVSEGDFTPDMALEEPYAEILTETARIQVQPKIAYQFSNVVSADLFVDYENFIGDSRRLPYTQIEGGFNIRVSFSY